MKFIFLILLLILFSCSEVKEHVETQPKKDSIGKKEEPKVYFDGKPDIPSDSFSITESGVGPALLGQSLKNLSLKLQGKEFTITRDYLTWPAMIFQYPQKKWLITEAVNTVDVVNKIRTNSSIFKTRNGIHPGMPLDSIFLLGDSMITHTEFRSFQLKSAPIYFKVDDARERKFFGKGKQNIKILEGAIIEEIFIICGDC